MGQGNLSGFSRAERAWLRPDSVIGFVVHEGGFLGFMTVQTSDHKFFNQMEQL
jgi:hypothetical protein